MLLLCKYSVNIQESMTALMLATQCGHKYIVKVLVERNANPNITADKVGLCFHVGSRITGHCVYRPVGGQHCIWPLKEAMLR